MKQSIYQKLLLSLMLLAFFGTLASAQVMSRSDVDVQQIEAKKQVRAIKKTPAKRTEAEIAKIRAEKEQWMKANPQVQKKAVHTSNKPNVRVASLEGNKKMIARPMAKSLKSSNAGVANNKGIIRVWHDGQWINMDVEAAQKLADKQ